jgi:trehalose-6-phosphatase
MSEKIPPQDAPKRLRELLSEFTENGQLDLIWGPDPIQVPLKPQERYCLFLDIDGTLLKHFGDKPEQFGDNLPVLDGVPELVQLCGKRGHIIILTSGRRESFREITERQLKNAGIPFDQLILGCGNGIRLIVNDTKPYRQDNPQTAFAFNLERDKGVQELVEFLRSH